MSVFSSQQVLETSPTDHVPQLGIIWFELKMQS